ncbi:mevalonate kinase [Silvanigrella aquatica]|uniref:GHMP kinase N-terminal domain-containing protein n=1 Tax=Silvanigrella aquatica TaxID=1915309 RepID=A0A1L4CYR0_9BACT|nr:hypothetical protein [Silvanigrella aquatica]APJ03091.1 hypothetical protein AXG55_03870 [Silvanigrella aquatica]
MNRFNVCIPAKALLFGEYGVLYGGRALAVTFFQDYFQISATLKKQSNNCQIKINSDFFNSQSLNISNEQFIQENKSPLDRDSFFFVNLLKPWHLHLKNWDLEFHIENSFSPSLGFGSSSALIAGFSKILWQMIYNNKDYLTSTLFWKNVRTSIQNIQGQGSGYDVAVQLAGSNITDKNVIQFWSFQNQEGSAIPKIESFYPKEHISNLGCFIATHIYSDTKKALKKFQSEKNKLNFAAQHSDIANELYNHNSFEDLALAMQKSLKIAQNQEIIPTESESFNNLLAKLDLFHIPFKTMGAGHGDCIWVLAKKSALIQNCQIPEKNISFAFENYGS